MKITYNPYSNSHEDHANGNYLNFLETEQVLVIPVFNRTEDELALRKDEEVFPGRKIATIDSNELAYKGGILNCISWNVFN